MANLTNLPECTAVVMDGETFEFVKTVLWKYLKGTYYGNAAPHEDIEPFISTALDVMNSENKQFGLQLEQAHSVGLALSMARADYVYEYNEIKKEVGATFVSEYQRIGIVIKTHWWPVHERNFKEVAKQAIQASRKGEQA